MAEAHLGRDYISVGFDIRDGLPPGYILGDSAVFLPAEDVPVYAHINGKKMLVGKGHLDPETFIFTTVLDDVEDNPAAGIWLDSIKASFGELSTDGFARVSEVTLDKPASSEE